MNLLPHVKIRIFFYAVGLLAAMSLISACSDQNLDAPADEDAHPIDWSNPVWTGDDVFHGDAALTDGLVDCMLCHGDELQGIDSIPGCRECHFDTRGSRSPGGSAWSHGILNHQNFETVRSVCSSCHDAERRFNAGPAACHDCHLDDE